MRSPQPDPALNALFQKGTGWGDDRLARIERSNKLAWSAAAALAVVAVLEAMALAGLAPLKTVVPITVLVDRQTGFATTVDPTKAQNVAPDAALTRSMLAQYVMARETVDRAVAPSNYRKTMLWSGDVARRSYVATMSPTNPSNPYLGLPRSAAYAATIRSVSSLSNDQAIIRYDVVSGDPEGREVRRPFVSIMRYRFRQKVLSEEDRFINPLGFEVINYRKDPETIATVTPAVTSASSIQESSALAGPDRSTPPHPGYPG